MMKLNKKVVAIFLALTLFGINSGLAIEEIKLQDDTHIKKSSKFKNFFKRNKKENIEEEQSEYTNDIHSVLSLKDCIAIAIKYNPTIRASIYNEAVYKSQIGLAWANYFPELDAGFQVSREGQNYSGDRNVSRSEYQTMAYIPTLSANMLLFDFGKTKASADSAKRYYEASKAETKENINSIIYDIKTTYYNILFASAQVQVYKDTVKDYELQLSQAQSFYKLGKKARIDVVTAEYNHGKAKLNLVKAQNVLEVAIVELSKIMGIPEYTNYELSDELSLNDFNLTIEELIKTAFDVRPELIAAQKNVEAAKLNLRAERRNYTPNLGVFAGYGNGIGNNYDVMSAQVGVGLNYSGFNALRVKKRVDEANAQYKKAKADFEDIKHEIHFNIEKDFLELQTAKEEIVIAKLALDQAREQYRQVTGRYKAGVGDAIELKDGENTYLNARLDFYNAMLNYNTTAASLEREIGVPLTFSDKLILKMGKETL